MSEPPIESEADVVVIGGGIVGCATAYYAAQRGASVVLVDKGDLGFEQSTRNWGWVHQQVRYPHLIPLATFSVSLWGELEKELEAELEWVQGGNLSLAFDEGDLAAFADYRERATEAGLEASLLGREQVAELAPELRGPWIGALHVPTDGQADPERVTAAFARAAARHGARLYPGCAAEAITLSGGAVAGVLTERGEIRAPRVLCAAGAWSRRVLRPLGMELPQSVVRATVVRTEPVEALTPLTGWGRRIAFRQDRRGRFVLAGGMRAFYDLTLDALRDLRRFSGPAWSNRRLVSVRVGLPLLRDLRTLLPGSARRHPFSKLRAVEPPADLSAGPHSTERIAELFPKLAGVGIEKTWAGNIDMTPDQAPVLEALDEPQGLVIATGLSGHGFALGPATGRIASELLAGVTPALDLRPYRLSRFAEGDLPALASFRP